MDQGSKKKEEQEEHGSYVQVPLSGGHSEDYAPYPKLNVEDEEVVGAGVNPRGGTSMMGSPANPNSHPVNQQAATWVAGDNLSSAPQPPPQQEQLNTLPQNNPYVATSPAPKSSMDSVRDTLGKWGKKVGEATKMTGEIAGNVWQHLKTGPSLADTAMERIAQGTKVLTEGGYEKIFRQNFDSLPEEKLLKTYACYLSTSAGPVIGTLYLTDRKIAFCSDNPLSYKVNPDKTEWSFYKVVLPFNQLKAVNASANKTKPSEKYTQIVSTDNHEFWFMGFVNYDKAVKNLQGILTKEGTETLGTQSSGGQFETI